MLKGLVVGDCHFCDYVPIKRTDNFLDAQFKKIDKIKSIAEELQCDAIFLLGDIFDKARPEIWLVNKVIDHWRDCACSIFSVTGNHDLQGCRDGVPGTALGNLFTAGVFKQMKGDAEILGIPTRTINHTREHTAQLYVSDTPKLIFTHNMITPQEAPFDHVHVDKILKLAKNNFIFAGDFHPPFDRYSPATKTHVVNPGVLVRTSIAEKDIDPSVIYFEATTEDLVTHYRKISLESPKGDDVFNILLHDTLKENELDLKQFIDSIKQTQFESQDVEKLVRKIGIASFVSKEIIAEAIERIKIAKATS